MNGINKHKTHDEIIKNSHKRSMEYGVEKERVYSKKILSSNEMHYYFEKNMELINTAKPFMEGIYDFLKDSDFFMILTDNEGCILNIIGDKEILKAAKELNMVIGAYMDEKSIGTNAMGTAIKEKIPLQVTAKEHFITAYHKWTCSASPIKDSEENIIGTLNLTGISKNVHPHTLGLVVAAVKSIENEMKMNEAQRKIYEAYTYMNTIMDSISSGIYAVGKDGIVRSINKSACEILGMNENDILNKLANRILPNWKEIIERLENGKTYADYETVINDIGNKGRYNVSATPIKQYGNIIGMVIVFKELQRVYNLVNKYGGKRAIYTFEDIIGNSDEIKQVIEYSKLIADSPSTVLIQGESGTGKELLAQAIHNYSSRKDNSFIAINCGAIPKSLIESELFGYESGSFTGAKKGGSVGKFELANCGTLFLDEIGEMPLDMQVSLLRVLQEGYITRVGGDKIIPVDVRIIAATNKDLKEEVKKGTFREDLFYRLSVIPIYLHPLRNRKGDLDLLMDYFIKNKSFKLGKNPPRIKKEIYDEIINYNWPGNIRELENFIENIVNLNGNTTFNLNTSKIEIKSEENWRKDEEDLYISSLEELEKKAIISCINKYDKNISKISKILGVSRNTLYTKMRKYNIQN